MWPVVWTTKLQFRKLVFSKINFNVMVLNIFMFLHIILSACPFFLLVFLFPIIQNTMFAWCNRQVFWNSRAKLTPELFVDVCIFICVSKFWLPGSCTLVFKWKIKLFVWSKGCTQLPWHVALTPWSIIELKAWDNIYTKYNDVADL